VSVVHRRCNFVRSRPARTTALLLLPPRVVDYSRCLCHKSRRSSYLRPSPSGMAAMRRMKSSIASKSRNAALSPLCTCSMRPRQRGPATDHSRHKRTIKILVATAGDGCAMGSSSLAQPRLSTASPLLVCRHSEEGGGKRYALPPSGACSP
jgi:hypothetical protein